MSLSVRYLVMKQTVNNFFKNVLMMALDEKLSGGKSD